MTTAARPFAPGTAIPLGVVKLLVGLLWGAKGDPTLAAAAARSHAAQSNEPERYQLLAQILDESAADRSVFLAGRDLTVSHAGAEASTSDPRD